MKPRGSSHSGLWPLVPGGSGLCTEHRLHCPLPPSRRCPAHSALTLSSCQRCSHGKWLHLRPPFREEEGKPHLGPRSKTASPAQLSWEQQALPLALLSQGEKVSAHGTPGLPCASPALLPSICPMVRGRPPDRAPRQLQSRSQI